MRDLIITMALVIFMLSGIVITSDACEIYAEKAELRGIAREAGTCYLDSSDVANAEELVKFQIGNKNFELEFEDDTEKNEEVSVELKYKEFTVREVVRRHFAVAKKA